MIQTGRATLLLYRKTTQKNLHDENYHFLALFEKGVSKKGFTIDFPFVYLLSIFAA